MAIKIITDFRVLLRLARVLARAEKSGDTLAIDKARQEHDVYRDLCLRNDVSISLGVSSGDL